MRSRPLSFGCGPDPPNALARSVRKKRANKAMAERSRRNVILIKRMTEADAATTGLLICRNLREFGGPPRFRTRCVRRNGLACERPGRIPDACRPLAKDGKGRGAIDTTASPIIPWEAFAPPAGLEYTSAIQHSWAVSSRRRLYCQPFLPCT